MPLGQFDGDLYLAQINDFKNRITNIDPLADIHQLANRVSAERGANDTIIQIQFRVQFFGAQLFKVRFGGVRRRPFTVQSAFGDRVLGE